MDEQLMDEIINELKKIVGTEPLQQESCINKFVEKFKDHKITKKTFESQLRRLEKEIEFKEAEKLIKNKEVPNSDFLIKEPTPPVSLAIGVHDNVFYIGKKLVSSQTQQICNSIITSNHQLLVDKRFKVRGVTLGDNQIEPFLGSNTSDLVITNTLSNENILLFLNKQITISTKELFLKIKKIFEKYYDFPKPETYILASTYVLMTYVYPLFPSVPYLELNAGKGSGKTKLLEIFSNTCFNGSLTTNHTEATLFRTIDGMKGCMCFDEYEPISSKTTDPTERAKERILNAGYKRGAKVPRIEKNGENYITRFYDVYSPKVIASVAGIMLPTLKSRCITPLLLKTLKVQGALAPKFNEPIWQEVRDECSIWALQNWREIEKIYYSINLPFSNRNREIWQPLLTITKMNDEASYNKLLDYATQLIKRSRITDQETESRELQLIEVLISLLGSNEELTISPKEISNNMPTYSSKGEEKPIMSDRSIGRMLTRWGIYKEPRSSEGIVYKLKMSEILDLKERLFPSNNDVYKETTLTTLNTLNTQTTETTQGNSVVSVVSVDSVVTNRPKTKNRGLSSWSIVGVLKSGVNCNSCGAKSCFNYNSELDAYFCDACKKELESGIKSSGGDS